MTPPSYPLTALTVVLGPPLDGCAEFGDFQQRSQQGLSVADHPWMRREHDALDALTHREGAISTHTVLERLLSGVLQIDTIIADVDRQWVRHADGQLYVALTACSEDVRPRAAGNALHDPSLVDALNALTHTIAQLDGRAWMVWSSRTWHDDGDATNVSRTTALVQALGSLTTDVVPVSEDAPIELVNELRMAIASGRALADTPRAALASELRDLRHRDPLRVEWARIAMDAFYLAALDVTSLHGRLRGDDRAGLAYLYLGKERSDRLKANPEITPRFRNEIAAKTLMTAYALERLAPAVSQRLYSVMCHDASLQDPYSGRDTAPPLVP
ncbi:MAG: hypothetical protein IT353_24285 [Gemmatimonadaceae bacterium]|nr:hypothetical protein [Gemmatimonadaceae bacterium]